MQLFYIITNIWEGFKKTIERRLLLKEKELLFCKQFTKLQNPKEAAIKAGYSYHLAEKTASKLLLRKDIKDQIKDFKNDFQKNQLINMAIEGLKRLAFSRNNDSIWLAMNNEKLDEKSIQEFDLFSVSEFKRVKDGGFEFKFTDRIKALQALIEITQRINDDNQVDNFLKALASSAEEPSND